MIKKTPYKTERERALRDYYMYFIESGEGITKHTISTFKKDSCDIMEENFLYPSVLAQNKLKQIK